MEERTLGNRILGWVFALALDAVLVAGIVWVVNR